MRAPDCEDVVRFFEDRLRGWSQRPPRIPANIARTRVLARLPEVSRPVPWMRLIAAATLVAVLVVAVWRGSPRPAGEVSGNTTIAFAPSLDSNVVMWVVDSRTTVYFVLSRHSSEKRGLS